MKKKCLVVDDTAIHRNLIKTFLMFEQFEVDVAEDGLIAYKKIQETQYDLIFSDIEMPNMNGFELLTRIKKSPLFKNIPVVMLTTLSQDENIEKAKKLGANAYIVKPFSKDKIQEALTTLGFK